jgi:hypothetical protein
MIKIHPQQIDVLIEKGVSNIKKDFRQVNGKAGWHQHLGTDKVGNTATAIGILLLNKLNKDFNHKHIAVDSLRQSQLIDKTDKSINGGWNYVSNLNNLPATDPTCWALQALNTELATTDITIQRGIGWLLSNHSSNGQDNGWGTIHSDVARTYSTCIALRTLKLLGYDNNPQFQSALSWLRKAQNDDFGWGDKFGFPSTVNHTAQAIITLLLCNSSQSTSETEKGIEWLNKSFDTKPFWENLEDGGLIELNDIKFSHNGHDFTHRISYYHFSTPYAIIALIKSGKLNSPIVFKGIEYLLKSSNKGYWEHPYLLNHRIHPIWAIYDSVLAFTELKQNTNNWIDLLEIKLKDDKIIFHYNNKVSVLATNQTQEKGNFKLELSHKIALGALIVATIVMLFGNNILGRLTDKETTVIISDTTAVTNEIKSDTTLFIQELPYLQNVPIIDKGLFIKYYFNDFIFGGANLDIISINARTKSGESLPLGREKMEVQMDITKEPFVEFEYKGIFYSIELDGHHPAINCTFKKIMIPTLTLKQFNDL